VPTQKQKALYWREWGLAVSACKAQGLPGPDRHALTKATLGRERSMLDLDNAQFDQVLAAFRALSSPDDLNAQTRALEQPRLRLHYKLTVELCRELAEVLPRPEDRTAADQLTAAERYILAIARDKFGTEDLEQLTDAQLKLLLMDTTRAIQRHAKRATTPF
jgi:hypothetical protein